ncbi:MAG: hypothetical protein AAGD25_29990 [Cyanobacteria bacterium P01_F01_bin.150]
MSLHILTLRPFKESFDPWQPVALPRSAAMLLSVVIFGKKLLASVLNVSGASTKIETGSLITDGIKYD